eukprot:1160678-Pelagomonas_calceolata.AAC.4
MRQQAGVDAVAGTVTSNETKSRHALKDNFRSSNYTTMWYPQLLFAVRGEWHQQMEQPHYGQQQQCNANDSRTVTASAMALR